MRGHGRRALSVILALSLVALLLVGCSQPADQGGGTAATTDSQAAGTSTPATAGDTAAAVIELPVATAGSDVDASINQETIDDYLGRDDVVYRDVRMLYDPANFGEGTESNLTATTKGFKVVPVVYLANVPLPLEGLYSGPMLYAVEWGADGQIVAATPNYEESEQIISDLFPKNKAIFLQCGAGVYAGFAKQLLIYLGYDADKVYNVGGNWSYGGNNAVSYALRDDGKAGQGTPIASWNVDYAFIDFTMLHAKQGS